MEIEDRDKLEKFVLNHPSKLSMLILIQFSTATLQFSSFHFQNGQSLHQISLFLSIMCRPTDNGSSRIEEYIYPDDSIPEYESILVPNVDNVRTNYLISIIAKQKNFF